MNRDVIITCAVTGAGGLRSQASGIADNPASDRRRLLRGRERRGRHGAHPRARPEERQGQPRSGAVPRGRRVSARRAILRRDHQPHGRHGRRFRARSRTTPRSAAPAPISSGRCSASRHVEELLPDVCSLDCGTLNFGMGDETYINTSCVPHRHGAARPGTRRQAGTRGIRSWPDPARTPSARAGADRLTAAVPGLPGPRLERGGRHRVHARDDQRAAG